MKNTILLLLIFAFSCTKEQECGGIGHLSVYNGLHVTMLVTVTQKNGTSESVWALSGQKCGFDLPSGTHTVTATGSEPGPFAHNEYNFEDRVKISDCSDVSIQY